MLVLFLKSYAYTFLIHHEVTGILKEIVLAHFRLKILSVISYQPFKLGFVTLLYPIEMLIVGPFIFYGI